MLGHSVLHDIGFNRIEDIGKADVPGSSQRLQASRLCSSSKVPEAEFGLAGAKLEGLCPQGTLPAIGFGSIQNLGSIHHRLLKVLYKECLCSPARPPQFLYVDSLIIYDVELGGP